MYRVYVLMQRKGGSAVLPETRTQTGSLAVAVAAFWDLYSSEYDNRHLLLMTHNNKQIHAYRYGSAPGERDYIAPGSALGEQ